MSFTEGEGGKRERGEKRGERGGKLHEYMRGCSKCVFGGGDGDGDEDGETCV